MSKELTAIPLEQTSAQIVRVPNGWVIYAQSFGYDPCNDRVKAPQLVFNHMSDAVRALMAWGDLHEGNEQKFAFMTQEQFEAYRKLGKPWMA